MCLLQPPKEPKAAEHWYSDRPTAIKTVRSNLVYSKLLREYLNRLNTIGSQYVIWILWIPIVLNSNETPGELASKGGETAPYEPEPFL